MTFGVQVSFILCCSALHSRQLKSSKDSEALNKCDLRSAFSPDKLSLCLRLFSYLLFTNGHLVKWLFLCVVAVS